jgi:DHA1 family bicyclomycin/chloramphenicol resistance-like MFS transporter
LTTTHPGDALSHRNRLIYVIVLGALTALGPFTVDLYLPAFPMLQAELGVPASSVQLTLTGTIIGFAVGQLLVGPLSDKVGRRLPLILATFVHIAASLGAALSSDIGLLLVFRVLQGIGAAGGGVVAAAMVRDLFTGYRLVRMFSHLSLVNGMAPIFAPLIGSQLLAVLPWQGVFWFLAAYGLAVIVSVSLFIPETLPVQRRRRSDSTVLQRYRTVLADRAFVGILVVAALNFAGLFSYLSASPFLFQEVYGLDAQQYGLLFAVNSLGIVAGVQISSRVLRTVDPKRVMAAATAVMLAMSLLIALFDLTGLGFWGTVVPLWLYIMGTGFMFPCIQVLAMSGNGEQAGTAAALLGAGTFGAAGVVAPIAGFLDMGSAAPMGAVMAASMVGAIAALWLILRPHRARPQDTVWNEPSPRTEELDVTLAA